MLKTLFAPFKSYAILNLTFCVISSELLISAIKILLDFLEKKILLVWPNN